MRTYGTDIDIRIFFLEKFVEWAICLHADDIIAGISSFRMDGRQQESDEEGGLLSAPRKHRSRERTFFPLAT